MNGAPLQWLRRGFFYAALLALPLISGLKTQPVFDVWWHLAAGRLIAQTHAVPWAEVFSWGSNRAHWVAYSWLYELGFFALHSFAGDSAQILVVGAFGVAIFYQLEKWISEMGLGSRNSQLAWVLGAGSCFNLMTARPWLVSILFLILELRLLRSFMRAPGGASRAIWWLVPLVGLWSNLHIEFAEGLLVLALASGSLASSGDLRGAGRLAAVLLAAVGASFANPYGYHLYEVIWGFAGERLPAQWIQEAKPMDLRLIGSWACVGLGAWAAFRAGTSKRRASRFALLFFAIGNLLALRMTREAWIGALASLNLLSETGGALGWDLPRPVKQAFAFGLSAIFAFGVMALGWGREELELKEARKLPETSARFLQQGSYPGPLFNSFEWGGYLIWELPQYRVSMDGRTNMYDPAKLKRNLETFSGTTPWTEDTDLARANLAIVSRSSPLDASLGQSGAFKLVHQDELASVYRRTAIR